MAGKSEREQLYNLTAYTANMKTMIHDQDLMTRNSLPNWMRRYVFTKTRWDALQMRLTSNL